VPDTDVYEPTNDDPAAADGANNDSVNNAATHENAANNQYNPNDTDGSTELDAESYPEPYTAPPTEPESKTAESIVLPAQSISQTQQFPIQMGTITIELEAYGIALTILDTAAVITAVLTADEIANIAAGDNVVIRLRVIRLDENGMSSAVRTDIETGVRTLSQEIEGLALSAVLSITTEKSVNGGNWVTAEYLRNDITLRIAIPDDLHRANASFFMLRHHNGIMSLLPNLGDDPYTITFSTDRFSPFAILYTAQRFALGNTMHVEILNASGFSFQFGNFTMLVFAPFGYHAWALLNLALSILSLILAAYFVTKALIKKRRDEKEGTDDLHPEALEFIGAKWLALTAALALVAVFLFILMQPFGSETILLFDFWVVIHVLIVVAQLTAMYVSKKEKVARYE